MRLLDALTGTTGPPQGSERRFGMDTYASMYFDGNRYVVGPSGSKPDEIDATFVDYIHKIHRRHGVVAAAVATRALLLSQVRFKWRRPDGSLYGTPALRPLERPGSTTRPALLSMLEHDASYSGTGILARRRGGLWRLAPDRVRFVLGSESDPSWDGDVMIPPYDAEVVGVTYDAGRSRGGGRGQIEYFTRDDLAIWTPEPDPVYFWKGTSWVSSVVREVLLDGQSTDQTGKYFENGSVPSLVFLMDADRTPDELEAYQRVVDAKHSGVRNRFKNLFLGGATDVKVLDPALNSDSLSHIQGTFENRVAVRSRIPAVVLGTKESLSGSSLNSGNYSASRRLLADGWFSPTVDGLCAALESIVPPPDDGSELGHDPSRVLFLQEDQADAASIMQTHAVAMRQWVEAGYEPESVTEAVISGDISKLVHTGNVSVQLQPPGSGSSGDRAALLAAAEERANRDDPEQLRFELHNHTHVTRSDVTVEPPVVNVSPADVHVVNEVPEVRADTPIVNVTVDPTPVTVENQVNPTPVTIENEVNVDTPPAQVTVVGDDKPARFKVRRNNKGEITEVNEGG